MRISAKRRIEHEDEDDDEDDSDLDPSKPPRALVPVLLRGDGILDAPASLTHRHHPTTTHSVGQCVPAREHGDEVGADADEGKTASLPEVPHLREGASG